MKRVVGILVAFSLISVMLEVFLNLGSQAFLLAGSPDPTAGLAQASTTGELSPPITLSAQPSSEEGGSAEASTATMVIPQAVQAQILRQPPLIDAPELERREALLDRTHLRGPPLPGPDPNAPRRDPSLIPQTPAALPSGAEPPASHVSGTFTLFRNTGLPDSATANSTSTVDEPSGAMSGPYVFMSGNWYASVSSDGGQTFGYINPYTTFPASDGGFCCDQVVIYDPSRDLFFWLLQYVPGGNGNNRLRLAVARGPGVATGSWYYYDFTPQAIGYTTSRWFDYPDLALSNNNIYIAVNTFDNTSSICCWRGTNLLRLPLDPILDGSGFTYYYITSTTNFTFKMTHGARESMYWASHNTYSQIRVFRWPEAGTTYYWNNVNVTSWIEPSTYLCPSPDGRDACGRLDSRMLAGAVYSNTLLFMWNAGQGGSFPYPYVDAARITIPPPYTLIDQPLIWHTSGAWIYPHAAPNARGHLAISLFFSGGSYYPRAYLIIDDDYNGIPPPWENVFVAGSTHAPYLNKWGDYVAVRPFFPTALCWVATSFTLQGGYTGSYVEPRFVVFGRDRDRNSCTRWWSFPYRAFIPVGMKQHTGGW